MTTTFPNGQQLVSSALTPDALLTIFQQLTAQMLGLNPQSSTDPAYASVRLDWPTAGQPAWAITDNVVFLSARQEESEYSRIRDVVNSPNDGESVTATTTYTRQWRIAWAFYGPNSFDQARLIKSALFLDWTHDSLAASNLYRVRCADPRYLPELFSGQWWKRTDLSCTFYEGVTESILVPTISSAEVLVFTEQGQAADLQAS